jgi:hypothetical protein
VVIVAITFNRICGRADLPLLNVVSVVTDAGYLTVRHNPACVFTTVFVIDLCYESLCLFDIALRAVRKLAQYLAVFSLRYTLL